MKTIDLPEILKLHKLWLDSHPDGERANLSGANLCGANLRGADLCGANLRDADLRGANLCDADLRDADLRDADLRGANLCGADLRGADLRDANLRGANLRGANLRGAYLWDANLRGANLCGADLRDAYLWDANLNQLRGLRVAACHWSNHGETGRVLNAAEIHGKLMFFCGCFKGDEESLRKYITADKPEYAASRTKALEFLLSCFES
jgi:hypothetical protein